MSSGAIENAKSLRLSISARLDELEKEREFLVQQLAGISAFLETADQLSAIDPNEVPKMVLGTVRPGSSTRRANPSRHTVIELAIESLKKANRPMRLRELYKDLVSRGVALSGADPTAVLGTMLWRGGQDGVLINLKGRGYWPASLPFPPANYEPKADNSR